jgi:hypothetical protein
MSTIVTRSGKGSPLSHVEVDANFTNLNTDKIQSGNTVAALTVTSATINGGAINGTTIGATTASTGAFTSLAYSTTLTGGTGIVNLGSGQFYKEVGGNIGLGTASPSYKLDVTGQVRANSGASASALIANSTSAGGTALNVQNSGTVNMLVGGYSSIVGSGSASDVMLSATQGNLAFGTGSSSTERMRIDSSGNVGIGTSSPAYKLDVNGRISYSVAIGEGADTTLSSAGTTIRHAVSATWTAQEFYTGGTERMRITSAGDVLIKNTTRGSQATLCPDGIVSTQPAISTFQNATSSQEQITFRNPNGVVGTITTSASLTSYNISSDRRLKENITPLKTGLASVLSLKPSQYNYKTDPTTSIQGFIADELQQVVPHAVTGEVNAIDKDGKPIYQGVDASFLIPFLVSAIQELNAKITALENK